MIRKMNKEDYNEVKELFNEVHNLHLKNRPDIYKDADILPLEVFNDLLANYDNLNYVYVLDNKVVGVLNAKITYSLNNPIMNDRKICFIESIAVHKDNRRQGIGLNLYEKLKEEIKDKNIDAIELNVWGFNENAIKFYESLGMTIKNMKFEEKL